MEWIANSSYNASRPSFQIATVFTNQSSNHLKRNFEWEGEASEAASDDLETYDDSDFSSGTNTECEFTDSEGKPNPFHKYLEAPGIVSQSLSPMNGYIFKRESPTLKKYYNRFYPAKGMPQISFIKPEPLLSHSSGLNQRNPNLVGLLQIEDSQIGGLETKSSQISMSLKKKWVCNGYPQASFYKKLDVDEMDQRLKSLMERLSSHQSLLKPAQNSTLRNYSSPKIYPTTMKYPESFLGPNHTSSSKACFHLYHPSIHKNGKVNSEESHHQSGNVTQRSTSPKKI